MRAKGVVLMGALAVVALLLAPPASAADPYTWTRNYTLFVTKASTVAEMHEAKATVEQAGGQVGVMVPNRVMLGWITPAKAAKLAGKGLIQAVYQKPQLRFPAGLGEQGRGAARFFNAVASGAWAARKSRVAAAERPAEMMPDVLETPKVPYADMVKNLEANGLTVDALADKGIAMSADPDGNLAMSPGNSDYMVGTVLFNAIFVESNGRRDPNRYTWTSSARNTIRSEIFAGLSWWANTARGSAFEVPLTFLYIQYYRSTRYEPVLHSSGQDYLWINEIMYNLGFRTGSKTTRTTAFNTYQRTRYNTNWSVTSFVGYNPSGAPSTFTNGYFAYAYLRGPYSQLLYRNNGWAISQYDIVNAHETGHLFGAVDEYYQAGYGGCTSCGYATNNVYNGNCIYCNSNRINCMMRTNSFALCGYTPGHLGWSGVQSLDVRAYSWAGKPKSFFVPGEKIMYRVTYCIAGPRLGRTVHTSRIRFRAQFFRGGLFGSSPRTHDTGWGYWRGPYPPTSTGRTCWWTGLYTRVPTDVSYGAASLIGQVEIAGIGRGADAIMGYREFFVTSGAASTEDGAPQAAPALFREKDEFSELVGGRLR